MRIWFMATMENCIVRIITPRNAKKAQETLPAELVRDIGMDEGVNEAFFEGKIRERCAPEVCPNPAE